MNFKPVFLLFTVVLASCSIQVATVPLPSQDGVGIVAQQVGHVTLETKADTDTAYVARIFQHEIDHLEGNLYTDKVQE